MDQRLSHSTGSLIEVSLRPGRVHLQMNLVVQHRNDAEGVLGRFGAFPMIVATGDDAQAIHDSLVAQLTDYLQAVVELNGPLQLLEHLEELGFHEAGEDDWKADVTGLVITRDLLADGAPC